MLFRIDKVYYINQDARVDRHWTQLFALELFGVPYDRVARFRSRIQNSDLPSYDEMVDMMVADGFTEWEMLKKRELKTDPTRLAAIWSKLSVMRTIIENDENAILLCDVNYLIGFSSVGALSGFRAPMTFDKLESICGELKDLKALDFHSPWTRWSSITNLGVTIKETSAEGIYYPMFAGRIAAILFTAAGAKEILDFYCKHPYQTTDKLLTFMFREDITRTGYYFCHPSPMLIRNKSDGYSYNRIDKIQRGGKNFYEQ